MPSDCFLLAPFSPGFPGTLITRKLFSLLLTVLLIFVNVISIRLRGGCLDHPWLLRSFGSSQSSQFNPQQLIFQSVISSHLWLRPSRIPRNHLQYSWKDRGQGKVFSWEMSVVLLRLQVNEKSFFGGKEASDVIP